MYPISYTKFDNVVTFRYDNNEYSKWIELGRKDGNVGQILVSIDYKSNIVDYKGFGTIENPFKNMMCLSIVNLPLFDGELREPEMYLKSYIEEEYKNNPPIKFIGFKILDLSEYNNIPNIQKK